MKKTIKKIIFFKLYLLSRMKFLHSLLPDKVLYKLPLGWNGKMVKTFMKPDGKVYPDIPCKLNEPNSYKPKVKTEDAYKMTEQEIQFFYKNGFTKPYTVCTPDEMESIRKHVQHTVYNTQSSIYPTGAYAYTGPKDNSQEESKEMGNEQLAKFAINSRDRHLDTPEMMKLFSHPAIIERCAQLLGPDLLIWRSQYFLKDPKNLGTALHQASVYLLDNFRVPTLSPKNMDELFQLTVWIALTDATIENGCMTVIPGTHREIRPVVVKTYNKKEKEAKRFGGMEVNIDYPVEDDHVHRVEMKAGQFFIFSERVIHGSLPNITMDQKRESLNFRVITPSTRAYNDFLLKNGNKFMLLHLKDINLDRWNAVLVKGEDNVKANKNRVVPVEDVINKEEKKEKPVDKVVSEL